MVSILNAVRPASIASLAAIAALSAPLGAHAQSTGETRPAGGLELEALPAQQLERGRCGLFLWAREAQAQQVFILVAYDEPAQARIRTGGRIRDLPRTSFAGEPAYGHFERQVFTDAAMTLDLRLNFDSSRPVRDGAVVRDGVLRIEDRGGWQIVRPVGGMVACKR
jgi:hypothetical protein